MIYYIDEPFKTYLTVFEILLNDREAIIMKFLQIIFSKKIIKKFMTFCEHFTVMVQIVCKNGYACVKYRSFFAYVEMIIL